jgi:hypothetical protein
VNIITDTDSLDLINASSIAQANATTAKDSTVTNEELDSIRHNINLAEAAGNTEMATKLKRLLATTATPLSIPVAIRHTEEGFLDLSAVNEGLITIERDGSFKDTPKLTVLITALDARAAKLRAKLRTEGLDIMLDPTLATLCAASTAYHATAITLEGLAEMLTIAGRIHSNLVDSIEDQMESSSDYLVATAREIEKLLAA